MGIALPNHNTSFVAIFNFAQPKSPSRSDALGTIATVDCS
jgi:hypothetical protein